MTLQAINTPNLWWPGFGLYNPNNPSLGSRTILDAAGEYHAIIFVAREAMTISHVGWINGTATGSPTVDIRIETVDSTTGLPTGTLWATNTNIVTGTLTTNTWGVYALTASASISYGQTFAVKFLYNSGTSIIVNDHFGAILNQRGSWSVANTGTPTIGASTNIPMGLGSSSTAFYKLSGPLPINALASTNHNNTSSGRRGVKFQLPFACRVIGAQFVRAASGSGDFNVGIWDDGGTEVGSSITAYDFSGSGFPNATMNCMLFDTPVELAANTNYRLAIEPTSATNCNMYHMTVADAGIRSGLPGGTACHLTTYTSGGGWDDSATTTIPWFDLIIDQNHDGASSGGGGQKVYGG